MTYRGPAKHPPPRRPIAATEALSGDHTHVVTLGKGQFPAWAMHDGSFAVDLRFSAETPGGERVFDILRLRALGVPEAVIDGAARAPARGFVLVDPKDEI